MRDGDDLIVAGAPHAEGRTGGTARSTIGRVARTWPVHSPTRGHDTVVLTELAR